MAAVAALQFHLLNCILVSGDKEIHEKSLKAETVKLDTEKEPATTVGEREAVTAEVTGSHRRQGGESLYKSPG